MILQNKDLVVRTVLLDCRRYIYVPQELRLLCLLKVRADSSHDRYRPAAPPFAHHLQPLPLCQVLRTILLE